MKDSFILHHDSLSVINELTDAQAGQLIKEIYAYSNYINNPKEANKPNGLNGLMNSVLHPFKMQLERDLERYSKVVERNSLNGKKGGRPKKEETQKKPTKPKKADSDSDSDSDSDKGKEEKKVNKKVLPNKKPKDFSYPEPFEKVWKYYTHDTKGDKWNGYRSAKSRIDEGYEIKDLINVLSVENKKDFGKRHFSTIMNGDLDIEVIKKPSRKNEGCVG